MRATDHRNIDLVKLNSDIIKGRTKKVLWQPRINCWYDDKVFLGEELPGELKGMSRSEMYRSLGVSARTYEFGAVIQLKPDESGKVIYKGKWLNEMEHFSEIETPVGTINQIMRKNTSNPGMYYKKWFIEKPEDIKVATYVRDSQNFEFRQDLYDEVAKEWGDLGLPCLFMPRCNIQHCFVEMLGVENTTYALMDEPELMEEYFRSIEESNLRYIDAFLDSPLEWINYGDNIHGGVLSPRWYEQYVLPEYLKRGEKLHKHGIFIHSHWDGDVKPLLKYAKISALDGIEAITPTPQGDVTVEEVKEALGDQVYLIDGIAALLFEETFPEEMLIEQTEFLLKNFGGKLILGISDEMASRGNIERVKLVTKLVDDYNAGIKE